MFQHLLEAIALNLDGREIPYMVVGGQAVLLYGDPRLTRDIDVAVGIGPERCGEIAKLAADLGWKVLVGDPTEFVRQSMVLPCAEPVSGVRVDFIFSFSTYEQQAMERVRRVPMGKAEVRFAAIEDLIIHKLIAGRPRDVEDVRNILLRKPVLDMAYLRRWLEDFDRSLGGSHLQTLERFLPSGDSTT